MERNSVGKSPRLPRLEDDSYANYLTHVRNFAIRDSFPTLAEQISTGASAAGLLDAGVSCDYAELAPVSQQKMTWDKCFESAWDIHLQPGGYCRDELAGPGRSADHRRSTC